MFYDRFGIGLTADDEKAIRLVEVIDKIVPYNLQVKIIEAYKLTLKIEKSEAEIQEYIKQREELRTSIKEVL